MNKHALWLDREIAEYIHKKGYEQGMTECHAQSNSDGDIFACGASLGQGDADPYPSPWSRSTLDRYIAVALARSIGHMARNSFFYQKKLAAYADILQAIEAFASPPNDFSFPQTPSFSGPLSFQNTSLSLNGPSPLSALLSLIEQLPFTTADELAGHPQSFLSIGQSEVEGLVSVPTSGTTGERKRVFCSAADLERTVRFFSYGMRLLLPQCRNQRVLLLMSGERPGSVGHLLGKALNYWSIPCDIYGFPVNPTACLEHIDATRPSCIVGLPSHLMTLCRRGLSREAVSALKVVLLSGEWASPTIRTTLEKTWQCPVFIHYGLTESGLAGAVECAVRQGCHIREADIHFSIIDSDGRTLPDGEWGEIVLTTLSREATPLLRYKTGDMGRILLESCPCGSVLKRLEAGERLVQRIPLPDGRFLGFGDLDAALYSLPWLANYTVIQRQGIKQNAFTGNPSGNFLSENISGDSFSADNPWADSTPADACSGSSLAASLSAGLVPGSLDTGDSGQGPSAGATSPIFPITSSPTSPLSQAHWLSSEEKDVSEEAQDGKEPEADIHTPAGTPFLELRLECIEPFTARHWEECARNLSAISSLRVVRSMGDSLEEDDGLAVILTVADAEHDTNYPGVADQGQGGQAEDPCEAACPEAVCFGDVCPDDAYSGAIHVKKSRPVGCSSENLPSATPHHATSHHAKNSHACPLNDAVVPHDAQQSAHGYEHTSSVMSLLHQTRPDSLDEFIVAEARMQEKKVEQSASGAMDKRRIYGVRS